MSSVNQPKLSRTSSGVLPKCSNTYSVSSGSSAICVCSRTPYSFAISALRVNTVLVELIKLLGPSAICTIADGFGSCHFLIKRIESEITSSSSSAIPGKHTPPSSGPSVMEPRTAIRRIPTSVASSITASIKYGNGWMYS